MDLPPDGAHVRLRTRVPRLLCSVYADKDGVGVSYEDGLATAYSVWFLDRFTAGGTQHFIFRSAANGRYLSLERQTRLRHVELFEKFRAVQRSWKLPQQDDILWEPIKAPDAGDGGFMLQNAQFGVVLEEEGDPDPRPRTWLLEDVPRRASPPDLPRPTLTRHPGGRFLELFRWLEETENEPRRNIRFTRADQEGDFDRNSKNWKSFSFSGLSISDLRDTLRLRRDDVPHHITICVRAGHHGHITPLFVDLPENEEDMEIIVLVNGSPGQNSAVFWVVCAALATSFLLFQHLGSLKFIFSVKW